MKPWAVLMVLALALAGCMDSAADGDLAGSDPVDEPGASELPPLEFTVDVPNGPIQGGTEIVVTTNRLAMVAVGGIPRQDFVGDHLEVNGTRVFEFFPEPGLRTIGIDIMAEDFEGHYEEHERNFLAQSIVTIDYGSSSDKEPLNDTVWVNMVDYDAQATYDEDGRKHPEYVNIHDVLAAWENQTGNVIEYSYSESFASYGVERINGEGNPVSAGEPPWWCYQMNDDGYASQGITPQRFTPGDVISWDLGTCGNVMGGT